MSALSTDAQQARVAELNSSLTALAPVLPPDVFESHARAVLAVLEDYASVVRLVREVHEKIREWVW